MKYDLDDDGAEKVDNPAVTAADDDDGDACVDGDVVSEAHDTEVVDFQVTCCAFDHHAGGDGGGDDAEDSCTLADADHAEEDGCDVLQPLTRMTTVTKVDDVMDVFC